MEPRQCLVGVPRNAHGIAGDPAVRQPHQVGSRRRVAWRRLTTIGVLALLCWLVGAALPTPGYAHAELVSTMPTDGQRLESPPSEVRLRFSESVRPVPGGVRLLKATGQEVPTAEPRVAGPVVILPLPRDLPTGGYLISWRVVSSDTHPIAGAFGFGIRTQAPRAASTRVVGEATPGVRATVAVGRWTGYAGLALLLGGTVFLLLCWPAGRALGRSRWLVTVGWAGAVAAVLAGFLARGPYVAGTGWSALDLTMFRQTATSQFGVLYLVRLALLVPAGLLVRRMLRSPSPGWLKPAAGALLGAGIVATYATTGHAAAGHWPAMAIVSDAVHVTAMSVWAGGLVLLAACALRPRHQDGLGDGARRFSRLAADAVAVLVVTGSWQAWRELGSVEALTGTDYGRLLLVKLAVVAGLLGLGAVSRYAVRHARSAPAWLRRSVPAEIALVAVVLAVTATLVSTPPGREAGAGTDRVPAWADAALPVPTGGTAHLRVTPAVVGMNQVSITMVGVAAESGYVREVTGTARLPERNLGPFKVYLIGAGSWFAGHVTLPLPGTWRFAFTIRTSDIDAYTVTTSVHVGESPR